MIAVLILSLVLPVVLLALAILHAYWGIGGLWPAQSAMELARTVVGFPGVTQMPGAIACFTVAIVLVLIGLWPLAMAGALPSPLPIWLMSIIGWGIAAVFFARGIAAYLPAWRHLTPEQPFGRLDQRVYGPLCIALGIGYLMFLIQG